MGSRLQKIFLHIQDQQSRVLWFKLAMMQGMYPRGAVHHRTSSIAELGGLEISSFDHQGVWFLQKGKELAPGWRVARLTGQ